MSFLTGLKAFLSGGTGKEIVGFIRDRWPAKMSEEEQAQLELAINEMEHKRNMDVLEYAAQQEQMFNERTIKMEGTAGDLQNFGFLGTIVVFFRGMFRPIFAYFTLYLDYKWLAAGLQDLSERQEAAMFLINVVVLVFFFGERAIKNLMPVIGQVFGAKANG